MVLLFQHAIKRFSCKSYNVSFKTWKFLELQIILLSSWQLANGLSPICFTDFGILICFICIPLNAPLLIKITLGGILTITSVPKYLYKVFLSAESKKPSSATKLNDLHSISVILAQKTLFPILTNDSGRISFFKQCPSRSEYKSLGLIAKK